MSWGQPDTPWETEKREVLLQEVLDKLTAPPRDDEWERRLNRFISCYQEGDKLYFVREGNNHSGHLRYLGTDGKGFFYQFNLGAWMT